MKSITVIGLLICVLPAKISADLASEVEANLRAIFELWKSGEIHNRIPFKVPPVEPLPMPPFCDNINKLGVKAYVETGILDIYGLKAMTLDKVDVSESAHDIELSMSVPEARMHSDSYSIKGKAMMVYKVKGSGTLDITLHNVKGGGKFHLQSKGDGTEIDGLSVKVSCDKAEGNLENASWPINNLINTKGRQLVEAFKSEIQKVATKQVQTIFAEPLSKIAFDDILQYMKDILANTLIKRTDSVEGFNNSTEFETVTATGNELEKSAVIDVEAALDNTADFRKIPNGSVIARVRN